MTPQERDLLDRFLADLDRARPGTKDAEAADRIERALRANPDAAYVLVQHAILADQALQEAQARIDELERGGPPPGGQGSFLGGGYGGRPEPGYDPRYAPPTAGPPTGGGSLGGFGGTPGPFSGGGGLGSFLRSAGTTAAGVAGGAFLFEGLSGLFGGHEHHQGFGEFGEDRAQGFADTGDGPSGDGPDFDYDDGNG